MPLMPTAQVEATKATQERIFSTLTPLFILPALTTIDNVQGGENKEDEKIEEDKKEQEEVEVVDKDEDKKEEEVVKLVEDE